jgi:hypothetical protein
MFKHFPGRIEIVTFAVLAVICATIVQILGEREAGLSLLAFPVFIFSAVMGLWKSGRLRAPSDLRATDE